MPLTGRQLIKISQDDLEVLVAHDATSSGRGYVYNRDINVPKVSTEVHHKAGGRKSGRISTRMHFGDFASQLVPKDSPEF